MYFIKQVIFLARDKPIAKTVNHKNPTLMNFLWFFNSFIGLPTLKMVRYKFLGISCEYFRYNVKVCRL